MRHHIPIKQNSVIIQRSQRIRSRVVNNVFIDRFKLIWFPNQTTNNENQVWEMIRCFIKRYYFISPLHLITKLIIPWPLILTSTDSPTFAMYIRQSLPALEFPINLYLLHLVPSSIYISSCSHLVCPYIYLDISI